MSPDAPACGKPSALPAIAVSAALAGVAGFVDAACFVGIFNVFTAHVTGNIAALASEFVHPVHGPALRIEVLIAFVAGTASARIAALRLRHAGKARVTRGMLAIEAAWLLGLLILRFALGAPAGPDCAAYALTFCAGAAMGAQSGIGKLSARLDHPTTMMTGNLTQWTISAIDVLRPQTKHRALGQFWLASAILLMFAAGAFIGALAQARFGFYVLALPLAIIAGLSVWPGAARL